MTTWFITGASSGLGRAVAETLLRRGDRVAATARRVDDLASLDPAGGDRLWTADLDVTDANSIRRVMSRAVADLGRLDVVLSNAGYGQLGAAEELTDDEIERQFDTNLIGSIHVIRSAITHMRGQGGGRILQVSSMGAHLAYPGASVYHASKWGIEGFVESVRDEVAPFGVELIMLEPGNMPTEFGRRSAQVSAPIDDYARGPLRHLRAYLDDPAAISAAAVADLSKVADAVIKLGLDEDAPRRAVLGSDAFQGIHQALTSRLAEIASQRDIASRTDALQS